MITDDDVIKLTAAFKTRQEDDESLYQLEDRLDQKFDRVLAGLDLVVGELKYMREEVAGTGLRVDTLEKDAKSIRRIPVIAHALKKG